jgi:hypothetical protein
MNRRAREKRKKDVRLVGQRVVLSHYAASSLAYRLPPVLS